MLRAHTLSYKAFYSNSFDLNISCFPEESYHLFSPVDKGFPRSLESLDEIRTGKPN